MGRPTSLSFASTFCLRIPLHTISNSYFPSQRMESKRLGVGDPTVAMEKTMKPCGRCYWSPILFPHPFHPPLSSPVASVDSSVTCWQHPISTTCSILLLWGFSLTLWEPKSKAAWKYWRFHAPRDNLYPMRNGSQWKNTQVPYPLVTQFSGTW